MSSSKKTVLVTGASGLIGRWLVAPLLGRGFDVHALTIDKVNPENGCHWINANLFDEASVNSAMETVRPDYLLNMAWATTGNYQTSDVNFAFVKAGITLAQAFQRVGGKRMVSAGTCLEYAPQNRPIVETDPVAPAMPYAICKDALHRLLESYCAQHGISFGWGRIFYVFGPGEDETRLTGALLKNLRAGKPMTIRTGSLTKDYMYSKDIAAAFAAFLDSTVTGSVNICTGKPITVAAFSQTVARYLGHRELLTVETRSSSQPQAIVGIPSRLFNEVGFRLDYEFEAALMDLLR